MIKTYQLERMLSNLEESLTQKTVESLKNQFTRFDVFNTPVPEKGVPIIPQDSDMQEE